MEIDIKELENIYPELDDLNDEEALYVTENGEDRFVILSAAHYEAIEGLARMIEEAQKNPVRVVGNEDFDITYEEYEAVKEQIIEALEKTLMPKPEKLN
ncbi:MAG: hypothetical protein IIZ33_05705 [Erysipelotrichaceae bacterium]|nr:hypothetical protein [Erysipelotrichaceae bacterium]